MRAILEKASAREGQPQQALQGAVAGLPPNVEVVYKELGSVSPADCSGAQVTRQMMADSRVYDAWTAPSTLD